MRNPRLRAQFFVRPDGVVIPKARPVSEKMRQAVFDRDGWRCRYCGRPVTLRRGYLWPVRGDAPGHVDHVFPRARGGQSVMDNLALACEGCNEAKAAD